MQQFTFLIVDSQDADADVPQDVSDVIMADIQHLITDIGELLIRQELRTQSALPTGVSDRFLLREVASGNRKDGTLLEDTLEQVFIELDRSNLTLFAPPETSNHIEAEGRRKIARDMLDLADHLGGYTMSYGSGGTIKKFRFNSRIATQKEATTNISDRVSAVIGAIRPDPDIRGGWLFTNGIDTVPITFSRFVSSEDIVNFSTMGPTIITGRILQDESGHLTSVKDVVECYLFPLVKFHRAITSERDIRLLNPIMARPGYNPVKGTWTLVNEDLGIDVSKGSWDEAVAAFHEYFMFLWETYVDVDAEFVGEEKDVRDFLLSLSYP